MHVVGDARLQPVDGRGPGRLRRLDLLVEDAVVDGDTVVPAHSGTARAALSHRTFRIVFLGAFASNIGTWMQTIAQSWLVLQLTGSGTAVGLLVAVQTLPVLVLGPYGGVVADRVDKRRLMIALQSMMGVLALVVGFGSSGALAGAAARPAAPASAPHGAGAVHPVPRTGGCINGKGEGAQQDRNQVGDAYR